MRIEKQPAKKNFQIKQFLPYIILAVLVIVAIIALVLALGRSSNDEFTVEPNSEYRNFYSADQIVSGGEALNDVSINDVNVSQDKDDLVLELQFHYNNASTEGKVVQTKLVPSYEIRVLPQPHRLCINLENVTQWEFTGKTSWLDYDLLQGMFVAQPTYSTSDNPTVILHLRDNIAYRVEEEDGILRIIMRKVDTQKEGLYHVLLNGLAEYASFDEVRALGMTPTLCDDLSNTLLISEGFETEAEAQAFIDASQETIESFLPGKTAYIEYLEAEKLPAFPEDIQTQEMENMPIILRDGEKQAGELLEINANVLASSPAGDSILCYSPVYSLDQQTGESIYSEILYLSNETDTYEKLVDLDFSMILYAQYSPDGRYVSFLDYNNEISETSLYCYDLQEDVLLHISESDFGTFVYDFVWDPDSTAIYAVTLNEDGTMCIRAFDFVANGDSHVTKLQDLNFSEGMLGATEDAIFYADTDAAGENETIYRMDKLTGESETICGGSRFVISPDGKLLAAETPNGLQIFDLANGDLVAQMEEAVTLSDFKFSHDSSRMFFVVDTEDSSSEYPGKFYMYDVEENEFSFLFATACIDFEWSLEANCVLVNFSYSTPSGYVPVTYRIRL